MSTPTVGATITVALLGNPNTGKSTIFSALVGVTQRIGNYPGVTVEKKLGEAQHAGRPFVVVDLPGTYSLAPRSPDEMVAVDVLLGRQSDMATPDVIVCIVDACNLERNLYLVSQALELGRPLVLALNKTDMAHDRGLQVNVARLRERLGIPVVEMQAHRRIGIEPLWSELVSAASSPPPRSSNPFPAEFSAEVAGLKIAWDERLGGDSPRYLVERWLLDSNGYIEQSGVLKSDEHLSQAVRAARARLAAIGQSVPGVETRSRYAWVDSILGEVLQKPDQEVAVLTDRLDRVLTHRVSGLLIFLALMVLVFQCLFSWAVPLQTLLEDLMAVVTKGLTSAMPDGVLESLLANGVVAGVGAVLVFVPQIVILFLLIAIMEDFGYMSRAAYLMDNLMSRVGLSGKSFIPLVSSFACAVPGIMATRVIEDRRDRLVTILVAPLMSCSARLPVYTIMIASFIPDRRYFGGWFGLQGLTMVSMYLLGIVAAIGVAMVLRRTVLPGETPPFLMELPDYRLPSLRVVFSRVWDQCWVFVRGAGTLILAVTVVLWALAYLPRPEQLEVDVRAQYAGQLARLLLEREAAELRAVSRRRPGQEERAATNPDSSLEEWEARHTELKHQIENHIAGAYMEQSWLGRLGKLIAPLVRPLGWDWRIGCAVVASFPAREVVIGAMGVIYNLGEGQSEESLSMKEELRRQVWPGTNRPIFTIPVALSIMVFFSLCAQCAATLSTIYLETKSWRWPLFAFSYMTCLAYVGALLTYHVGTWLGRS